MHHGLQDLVGETARLRAECDYMMSLLDRVEQFAGHSPYLAEHQHDEIAATTRSYAWSVKEHLEMAADSLQQWYALAERVLQATDITRRERP